MKNTKIKRKNLARTHKKLIKSKKNTYNRRGGFVNTTQGCSNCPANNPTMSELAWDNRFNYGKNCASGWGKNNSSSNLVKKGGKKKLTKRKFLIC